MKRIGLCLGLCAGLLQPSLAQEKRTALSLFGGAAHILSYGSEADYVAGQNDFPVTPAHTPFSFGLAVSHLIATRIGLELEVRDIAATTITLKDPSDGDLVRPNSLEHLAVTATGLYFFSSGKIRPYLRLGFGIDAVLDSTEQTLTTDLGYEVIFSPPDKKLDPTMTAGGGVLVFVNPRLAGRFDLRYALLPKTSDHPALHSLWASGGVLIRLF